jgi:predicted lysophospholipase L1 biosynthesis ABC-type transport system permease subunit
MTEKGRSQFPLREAVAFAAQGIRMRLGRMLLVLAGVTVAIGFTGVLLTSNELYDALPADEMEAAGGMTRIPVFRYLWIGVALLVCVTGTLNAIVMSVSERIKEIGTLKCLGSRDIHIVEIFLLEAALMGLVGGVVGGLAGYGVALLSFVGTVGGKYLTGAMALSASSNILLCMAISTVLALLASIIPVYIAAKVEPAAAMRYEV